MLVSAHALPKSVSSTVKSTVANRTTQNNTEQHRTIQNNTEQYRTTQNNTEQHRTIQNNTEQYRTTQNRTEHTATELSFILLRAVFSTSPSTNFASQISAPSLPRHP
jgi:hypothetical protein